MTYDIQNIIKKHNIKLVMPENAKSWQCDWKNCGWCCITERTDYHIKNKKCSKFNPKTKECKIYKKRLIDCKIYPYMIIVNQNGINLSPSLHCPVVSNLNELDDLNILDILTDKEVFESIIDFSESFLELSTILNLKISNDDDNLIIKLNEEFVSLKDIKNLESLKEFILSIDNSDILDFIKSPGIYGKYIQPNYTIDNKPNPIIVNLQLTKKGHIIFKNKTNTKIIKELIIPNNLNFDDLARKALEEYIKLNINRKLEFVSLYVCRLNDPKFDCKSAYISIWLSILKLLYAHLFLLVLRENVNIINYSIMREALSMTDSNLHGIILTKPNIP